MTEPTNTLGRVRVASPCTASWEAMEGDDRVRFCRECNLRVYNLSGMTRDEAESLVAGAEGRLCARFYRRADGTMLTKDCPVGLRALRRRASLAAGAVLTATLSFFTVASGKPPKQKQKQSCPEGGDFRVEKTTNANSFATVSGVVTDMMCAPIRDAEVTLTNRDTGRKFTARSSDKGEFTLAAVTPGAYTFEVNARGFRHFVRDDFRAGAGESARVTASLDVGALMGEVVIIETPKPDIESGNNVTVLRSKAITSLPH